MKFGYARVSTIEQNLERQIEALRGQGIEDSNIFTDKMSGAKEHRPALDDLLSRLREGDVLVVMSFDRLARSMKQLFDLNEELHERGVSLVSLHENIDTTTPQGKLFFTISAAFAEFERELIRERQAEGIAIAKREGRMTGRPKADEDKVNAALELFAAGKMSVPKISEATGVSKATIYRRAKERGVCRG